MGADDNDDSGLEQIESYLLWNAEVEEARRHAVRFTAQLPWLTTAQREEVERVYVADRVALSRAMLLRICDRATELRGEYTQRYRQLRRRCLGSVLVGVSAAVGALSAATLLAR